MFKAYVGLIKKEFIQVFHDHNMLRMIFATPIIQLILFGYVVNIDVKNISLDVYDQVFFRQSKFVDCFKDPVRTGGMLPFRHYCTRPKSGA